MRYGPLVLSLAVAVATSSMAQEPSTTIGVLTCTVANSKEGAENMACGYKATGSAADEKYIGAARGLSLGTVAKEVFVWTVIGPANAKSPPGFLEQGYARSKAPGHPPTWVGSKNGAIVLQFESHSGAEAGSGIQDLELKLAGTSA